MMDNQAEARATSQGCPLQHFEIAIGIAERGNRASADMLVDADRLSSSVVDEVDLRKAEQHRDVPPHLETCLDARSHHLLRRDTIDLLAPGPHELDAAT